MPTSTSPLETLAAFFIVFATGALFLLCHKSSFALALPQHGHCPSRAIS